MAHRALRAHTFPHRVLYASSRRLSCFIETLARLRPGLTLLAERVSQGAKRAIRHHQRYNPALGGPLVSRGLFQGLELASELFVFALGDGVAAEEIDGPAFGG